MKKIITSIMLALLPLLASAYDAKIDGIYYNFSGNNAIVTYQRYNDSYHIYSSDYSGAVVIPSSVTFFRKTYSVTSIGDRAFYGCTSLSSITIPNSVTSIGYAAFKYCSSLTSVTIPNSVTSIGNETFHDCSGLTEVYCLAENVPDTDSSAFSDSPIASATLFVPELSIEQYQTTEPWSGFGTIVGLSQDMIDGIREIESLTPALSKGEGEWYSLDGRPVVNGKLPRGVNLIRYSDGTTKKVLVK